MNKFASLYSGVNARLTDLRFRRWVGAVFIILPTTLVAKVMRSVMSVRQSAVRLFLLLLLNQRLTYDRDFNLDILHVARRGLSRLMVELARMVTWSV